jgi:hypothetical protein
MLETHVREAKAALYSNLRGQSSSKPTDVWNHAVYKYSATFKEAPGGKEKIVEIVSTIAANDDHKPPTNDTTDRTVKYTYIIEYRPNGRVKEGGKKDWKAVAGQAKYALANLLRVTAARWGGKNKQVTEARVRALDAAN